MSLLAELLSSRVGEELKIKMAKAKRAGAKRPKKKTVRRSMRVNAPRAITKVMTTPVEKAVRDYIALLKDPCNGPLVGPVGATANGYITRFEKTIPINPTNPNWYLKWAPGCISFAANGDGLYTADMASAATTPLVQLYNNTDAPGYAFLNSTCQTYRCLAACVQVRYTDTEVNRKGVLGSTIGTSARSVGNVNEGMSITVDRARVPDQSLEVLWQPGDGDEMFTSRTTVGHDIETTGRKNAIIMAGTGCLAASISLRLVVVYQWTPASDDAIVLPIPTPGTGVTMARVIQLARQAGFVAGHLIKGYATGGLYGVAREAASIIKPSIRNMR